MTAHKRSLMTENKGPLTGWFQPRASVCSYP